MDKKAIRDRIDLIAHERGLPESEVTRSKTCTDAALLAFAGDGVRRAACAAEIGVGFGTAQRGSELLDRIGAPPPSELLDRIGAPPPKRAHPMPVQLRPQGSPGVIKRRGFLFSALFVSRK